MRIFVALGLQTEAGSSAVARLVTVLLLSVGSVLAAGSASADTITGGSVDQARGCSTVNCALGTETFRLQAAEDVAGTITLDAGALTLDFTFTALSITVNETTAGTEDNGVASIVFSTVTYTGLVDLLEPVAGTFIVKAGSTASVSGDQTQRDDTSTQVNPIASDFDAAAARLVGNCMVVGDALNCGLTFGTTAFELAVGDPLAIATQTRFFQHTANIVAIPEPSTALMLGLALGLTALAGRRPWPEGGSLSR